MPSTNSTAHTAVRGLSSETRYAIRDAVGLAVEYWPNAHLGTVPPREDIKSAFRMLRSWIPVVGIHAAIGQVSDSAYRHMDM